MTGAEGEVKRGGEDEGFRWWWGAIVRFGWIVWLCVCGSAFLVGMWYSIMILAGVE